MHYGHKFRNLTADSLLQNFREDLEDFISQYGSSNSYQKEEFADWRDWMLAQFALQYEDKQHCDYNLPHKSIKYLKDLQYKLVFTIVDKASGNMVAVCKNLYWTYLQRELADTAIYEPCNNPNIAEELATASDKNWKLTAPDALPYLYITVKLHKVGLRFIAGGAEVAVTPASRLLHKILKEILATLRKKDDQHILDTGVRRFFIVNTADEVSSFLHKWLSSEPYLDCRDFQRMYTALPQADVIERVSLVLHEAFSFKKAKTITIKRDDAEWSRTGQTGISDHGHTFTLDAVVDLLAFVVLNTYLKNGNKIVRQKLGIPMGTNSGGDIANLYMYYYESTFVDRLMETNVEQARKMHMTFRLLDDLLSVNNETIATYLVKNVDEGGIYPAALTLEYTGTSPMECDFAGLNIKVDGSKFVTKVFDKRRAFPFNINKYPNYNSNMPKHVAYGVFVGELHRYTRACSNLDDLDLEIANLYGDFRSRGFSKKKLMARLRHFSGTPLVAKYSTAPITLARRWLKLVW
jgi:hypothetical protein